MTTTGVRSEKKDGGFWETGEAPVIMLPNVLRGPVGVLLRRTNIVGFGGRIARSAVQTAQHAINPAFRVGSAAGNELVDAAKDYVGMVDDSFEGEAMTTPQVSLDVSHEGLVHLLADGITNAHVPEWALKDVADKAVDVGVEADDVPELTNLMYIGPMSEAEWSAKEVIALIREADTFNPLTSR